MAREEQLPYDGFPSESVRKQVGEILARSEKPEEPASSPAPTPTPTPEPAEGFFSTTPKDIQEVPEVYLPHVPHHSESFFDAHPSSWLQPRQSLGRWVVAFFKDLLR